MPPDVGPRHVYHRFVVEVERPPDVVQASLAARGVAARRPVYRPAHRALGLSGFPEADRLWARTLSLPCYPTLTDGEIDTVAAALRGSLA
jgi:dTDP-4-amino-4,6-dideoxygalactose transaminase